MTSTIQSTKTVKILFLDWHKTLSNSLFFEQLNNQNHPHHTYKQAIEKSLFVTRKYILKDWMEGVVNSEEVMDLVAKDTGISSKILLSDLADSCASMKFCNPEIPNIIKKIRSQGTRVVIATDNMDSFRRFTVPGMKLEELFDDFLISSELGCMKRLLAEKTLVFFDDYLKNHATPISKTILMDDSIEENFLKSGLPTFEVKNSDSFITELNKYANQPSVS